MRITRWMLFVIAAATAGAALGDPRPSRVDTGALAPLTFVLERHAAHLRGRLLDVELEHHGGRWIYELEVLGDDGTVREFTLDAVTGDWIDEETARR